jgi:hypothetical protein
VTGTLGYLRHYPISHLQKSILSGKRDHISHKFPDEKSFVFSHKQVVYVVMASYHENALSPNKDVLSHQRNELLSALRWV